MVAKASLLLLQGCVAGPLLLLLLLSKRQLLLQRAERPPTIHRLSWRWRRRLLLLQELLQMLRQRHTSHASTLGLWQEPGRCQALWPVTTSRTPHGLLHVLQLC